MVERFPRGSLERDVYRFHGPERAGHVRRRGTEARLAVPEGLRLQGRHASFTGASKEYRDEVLARFHMSQSTSVPENKKNILKALELTPTVRKLFLYGVPAAIVAGVLAGLL